MPVPSLIALPFVPTPPARRALRLDRLRRRLSPATIRDLDALLPALRPAASACGGDPEAVSAIAGILVQRGFPRAPAGRWAVLQTYLVCRVQTDADSRDSLSELSEDKTISIRQVLDRLDRITTTMANILHELGRTSAEIAQNLK